MYKKVYICGDSFGCPDLGWNIDPWPILLQEKLGNLFEVINLSISCSSNLLIRAQVDEAINNCADYVLLFGTSSIRYEGKLEEEKTHKTLYDRFYRIGQDDTDSNTRDLACYSIASIDDTCVFSNDSKRTIQEYQKKLFDLDLAIYTNKCNIESSLYKLKFKNIPFLFDQGGFENLNFNNVKTKNYFEEFNEYRSDINLWDIAFNTPMHNPKNHFHIDDPHTHSYIAQYFCNKIQEKL